MQCGQCLGARLSRLESARGFKKFWVFNGVSLALGPRPGVVLLPTDARVSLFLMPPVELCPFQPGPCLARLIPMSFRLRSDKDTADDESLQVWDLWRSLAALSGVGASVGPRFIAYQCWCLFWRNGGASILASFEKNHLAISHLRRNHRDLRIFHEQIAPPANPFRHKDNNKDMMIHAECLECDCNVGRAIWNP